MLTRRTLLALLASSTAIVPAGVKAIAVATPPQTNAHDVLDRILPKLLAAQHVPSVSIAQIKNGRVAFTGAWGEQSAGVPATTATLYNIASLTKPLTAEIVLRLTSSGAFGLDEPMDPYWSDPDLKADPRRLKLTPRFALSHRTGFPNWRDRATGLKFEHDPGAQVGYSGEGFVYVARFAENKTGKAFEDLAQSVLFGPAQMHDTSYTDKPWFDGRIAIPTSAKGDALKPGRAKKYVAADLVYTTPSDYAAFLVDVLHDRGLSPGIAKERSRIQATTRAGDCDGAHAATCPLDEGFGLGWQIFEFKGETVMMHTGKDDGLFTFAYLNRATGDGAAVFTNGDNGAFVALPILEQLGTDGAFLGYLKARMG